MNLSANQATLAFLLSSAFKHHLAPRMLVIDHSFGDGYFCHEATGEMITAGELRTLQATMREWLRSEDPITLDYFPRQKVIEELYKFNSHSKLANLQRWSVDPVPVIRFREYWDYALEPLTTDKRVLGNFELRPYESGFLLRFPTLTSPDRVPPFRDRPRLFSVIRENEEWGAILGVSTIARLNELIRSGAIHELLWVAEGLHEKKISAVADNLTANFPWKRVVCIAGPSSSGKTTFAKRLSIQLKVNGYSTRQISMDNYFLNRDAIPRDAAGNQDFEAVTAVDLELLCRRLELLLKGKEIPRREFDFETGSGRDLEETLRLDSRDFVLVEGIHGLNPAFTGRLGSGRIQRIYISALTQLNIDANHRISTSDNRLLRRMVRDHKFRGYPPADTLARWPSVRLGEERNIFPFQEQADHMFNSALVYELAVLAQVVRPLLVKNMAAGPTGTEAARLETLLGFFEPLSEELVPGISILREFIGRSDFRY